MKRFLTPVNADDEAEGADYKLDDATSGCWIEYKGMTFHLFTPYGTNRVACEIAKDGDADTVLASCEAEIAPTGRRVG